MTTYRTPPEIHEMLNKALRDRAALLKTLERAERVFRRPPNPAAEVAMLAEMRATITKLWEST